MSYSHDERIWDEGLPGDTHRALLLLGIGGWKTADRMC
jgi:hypothetical protein